MKKIPILLILTFLTVGCGNLSPKINPQMQQQFDNQNGKIGQIETIQNGIKSEIGKLQQDATISNSKLDKIQQGLANFQSNYSNTGIQILSGPGGLVTALAILVVAFVVLHYRQRAITNEKASDMLAQLVVAKDDDNLSEDVFKMAMYTEAEDRIYDLITKYQKIKSKTEL